MFTVCPARASLRPYSGPASTISRARAPAEAASRVTLRKPGPATSTAAMPGFPVRRSATSPARSRGAIPAFLPSWRATLVAQSPCSRLRGRSTFTRAGVISSRSAAGRSPASTASVRTADSRAERSSGFTRASLRKGRRARARANEPCEMAPSGPRWGPSRRVRRDGGQAGQAARPPARDRTRPPALGSAPTTASRARAERAPAAQ
ncbi:Uncharacterised protein [Streptococcus pneumoniae]|nr:Uncharacterised protein [Streptococcus pneumoniae]